MAASFADKAAAWEWGMSSTHLRTLYARHDVIKVCQESDFFSGLRYVVYRNGKCYSSLKSLKEAMQVAERLSDD